MSIKGLKKELFVGKEEVNLLDSKKRRCTVRYDDLDKIKYRLADQEYGKMVFATIEDKNYIFTFESTKNDSVLRAIKYIEDKCPNIAIELLSKDPRPKIQVKKTSKLRHQRCRSCGKEYDSETDICPYCNYSNTDTHFKWLLIGVIVVLFSSFFLFTANYFLFGRPIVDTIDKINDVMQNDIQENKLIESSVASTEPVEAFSTTLTAGHYVVGIDIPVGTYSFFSKKGFGNLISSDGAVNAIFDYENQAGEEIGISDFGTDELKNIFLEDNIILTVTDTQEISAGCGDGQVSSMRSRGQENLAEIELGYGLYAAGDDFPPGTYNIEWLEGSGNIQTDPFDLDRGINELMGELTVDDTIDNNESLFYIKKYNNLILYEDDILKINDIKIKLIPSK